MAICPCAETLAQCDAESGSSSRFLLAAMGLHNPELIFSSRQYETNDYAGDSLQIIKAKTFSRNSRSGFALRFLSSGARVSLRLYPAKDGRAR